MVHLGGLDQRSGYLEFRSHGMTSKDGLDVPLIGSKQRGAGHTFTLRLIQS